jgi:hypothetical protein
MQYASGTSVILHIAPACCWTVGLLDCWTVGLLDCWTVGLLGCWAVGLLDCWTVGLLGCWAVGLLGCWVAAFDHRLPFRPICYLTALASRQAVPPLAGSRSCGIYYLPVVPDQASLVLLDSGLLNPSGLE